MWLSVPVLTSLVALLSPHRHVEAQSTSGTPEITLTHTGLRVAQGGTVSLFCQVVSGSPNPTIHWERNGRRLSRYRGGYYSITEHGSGVSVLRIQPVRLQRVDQAVFSCVASNHLGQARANASLHVYPATEGLPEGYPRILMHPRLRAAEKGRNTLMSCQATGSPQPQITWLRDGLPVDLADPRLLLLDSGFLEIFDSQLSDEAVYECVAENSVGSVYSYPAMLYVRVRRVSREAEGE